MRVVIAGGAGFIGSHLCDYHIARGDEVICIDNLGSGKMDNIKHLMDNPKFTFLRHNITEPVHFDFKVDIIYHLASRASPIDYQQYPVETALANSLGTYNLLNLAMVNDAMMLFASSSEAYGEPLVHPQTEDYRGNVSPTGVRSCYDESKRFGEALMMAFHREREAKTRVARIFNTFGPRMRKKDGRVIPNFITQCLKNEPITVYGDGKQTRSFCYVSDLVEGLYLLGQSDEVEPKNLGNPSEITVLEVANIIKKMTDSKSEVIFKPLPADDPTRRRPDISQARKLLGWEPKVSLEEGLKTTIEWFKRDTPDPAQ